MDSATLNEALHVLSVAGWVVLIVVGGVLGLASVCWGVAGLNALADKIEEKGLLGSWWVGAGLAVLALLGIIGALAGCQQDGPDMPGDAGAEAGSDRQPSELGAERQQDVARDQGADQMGTPDAGPDSDICPFACDEPDPMNPTRCISNCGPGLCCCAERNRCEVPLSASECCRR